VALNGLASRNHRYLRLRDWSLACRLKQRFKNAVHHIGNFAEALAMEAARREVEGMICGRRHHPEVRWIDRVPCANCADGVEICTALVEYHDGRPEPMRRAHTLPETIIGLTPADSARAG
jgi:UDP-2,3-diacylglucosamine pyrophosphatase LpxH